MGTSQQIEMQITGEMEKKPDAFMVLVEKLHGMPPEAIGSVLDGYERFLKIQAKQAYQEALATLKKSIPPIVKKRVADMAGKYQYNYAALEDVADTIDPLLLAHGFDYRWTNHANDKGVVIGCILSHVAGHSEETMMPPAPADNSGGKNPIQAIGSTLSYLQRYSLLMALGIAPRNIDRDGQQPKAKQGGKMPEKERDDRIAWFDKLHDYPEVDAHYKASYAEAHKVKDQEAMDMFIAARKQAQRRITAARKDGQ